MKILSTLLVAALFAFASCTSDKAADTNGSSTSGTPAENVAAPQTAAPATGTSDVTTADPNVQTQPVQPTQQQPAAATDGAVALNPPHGQPGHRCDIAVGAPLNSPPAQQQPQTIQLQ